MAVVVRVVNLVAFVGTKVVSVEVGVVVGVVVCVIFETGVYEVES